jgi:uncharacterized membrane protein YhaH (DUF805 family)
MFFAAFGFTYVYLKVQNSNGLWNAGHEVSVRVGTATLVAFAASAAAYIVALRRLRTRGVPGWPGLATVSLAFAVAAIGLHVWQLDTLPFAPTDGGYASVYIGWTAALIAVELGAMYWLLTLLRGALRTDRIAADRANGPEPLTPHLVASMRGYGLFWSSVVAIEGIAFALLVLVR